MEKKLLMISFAIFMTSAMTLQAGIRIGAKGGVNLAKAELNTNALKTENFTGFQIGPIVEFSGMGGLGVDAAVLYSQQGFKIAGAYLTPENYNLSKSDLEVKISTLDIPVNLKFKMTLADILGLYLSAGPYISFKLDDQITFDQIKTGWVNKNFGVGLNFGAGFELLKNVQVGVNYQLCLNDDYNDFSIRDDLKDIKAKTRVWSITAAYFF